MVYDIIHKSPETTSFSPRSPNELRPHPWWKDGFSVTHNQRQDSKVVSTHLWNTPLNLYKQAIKGFLS